MEKSARRRSDYDATVLPRPHSHSSSLGLTWARHPVATRSGWSLQHTVRCHGFGSFLPTSVITVFAGCSHEGNRVMHRATDQAAGRRDRAHRLRRKHPVLPGRGSNCAATVPRQRTRTIVPTISLREGARWIASADSRWKSWTLAKK